MKPPARTAVEARYRDIRSTAFKQVEALVQTAFAPTPVSLTAIGPTAIEAFRLQWESHPARRYPWPWPEMAADMRRDDPTRFEVAVWSGQTLCGLALGHTRAAYCGINYLEGCPANHPLRGSVTVIVSGAAVAYATARGKPQVRLVNPLPAMVPRYEALGFKLETPKGESPYCAWTIP